MSPRFVLLLFVCSIVLIGGKALTDVCTMLTNRIMLQKDLDLL